MEDEIEKIPKSMEKFFSFSGEMVKPSPDAVKAVVRTVRKGKVITLEQLRDKLAKDCGVQTACPASTVKALLFLAKEDASVFYWRVIKKKGELIAKFPNGVNGHAELLERDGFEIDFNKKTPVVVGYETKLGKFK